MRILELDLIAFGPFAGRRLVFPSQGPQFSIVQGPNEAGKSSALRAVHCWLFGFPHRVEDDFRHPASRLRVGGKLQAAGGDVFHFVRRRGRDRTLLDPEGNPWEGPSPEELLGGLDRSTFCRQFAFDYDELLQGSEALLQGHGELGQALFAAAGGLTHLRKLQHTFQEQLDSRFRPRAQNPRINALCRRIEQVRIQRNELLLTAHRWQELHRQHQQAKQRCRELQQRLAKLQQQQALLERIADSFPLLGRFQHLQEQLQRLEHVPLLAADFPARRQRVLRERSRLLGELHACRERVAQLRQEGEGLPPESPLLQQEVAIEELFKEIGQHTKAASDRRNLQRQREAKQHLVEKLFQQLRLPSERQRAEQLEASLEKKRRVQQLISRYDELAGQVRQAESNLQEQQQELEQARRELAACPHQTDPDVLRQAVEFAARGVAAEDQARKLQAELHALDEEIDALVGRLGFAQEKRQQADSLAVPGEEVCEDFRSRLEVLDAEQDRIQHQLEEIRSRKKRHREELRRLLAEHAVPSEEELAQARTLRNQGWQLICRLLEGSITPTDAEVAQYVQQVEGAGGLQDAFRLAMERADRLADQLRQEAQHVARRAALESELERLDQEEQRCQEQLQQNRRRREDTLAQWKQKWHSAGMEPECPKNMASWYRNHQRLLERLEQHRNKSQELQQLGHQQAQAVEALLRGLESVGIAPPEQHDSLSQLLIYCRSQLEQLQQQSQHRHALETRHQTIQRQLQRFQRQLEQNQQELRQWKSQWEELIRQLGHDPQASPDQVRDFLETAEHIRNVMEEIDTLEERIRGIDEDLEDYKQRVEQVVRRVAPELAELVRPDAQQLRDLVTQLQNQLQQARRERERATQIRTQLQQEEKKLQQLEGEWQGLENMLQELCREARCDDPEQLEQVERDSQQRQSLQQRQEELRERLLALAGPVPLDQWVAQVRQHRPEEVQQQLQTCAAQLEEVNEALAEAQKEEGRCEAELERFDGSSQAAALQQEQELLLDQLEEEVEHYVTVFLADAVLQRAIEQFRREQQGPVLCRASALFAQLTCGSFQRLQIGYDGQDQPVLVGVRPDGEQVLVSGMSDGTRDQLYLSLRLALLEHALERREEPIPFIVDDILIMFDDQRAAAALRALAELAQKTQVIFFTHHDHLVQLTQEELGPDGFHLVKLAG